LKPSNFDYARPSAIPEIIDLLRDESRLVKLMAGGQSLGPMLNMRLVQPDLVVDLTGVEELRRFDDKKNEIVIGACITHADIEDCRVPDFTLGALPGVANGIAYRAVRNRGTMGGSLTHADPSADWVSILAALGASVTIRGESGARTIAVEDYMLGALEADLAPGELLVSITVPKLSANARWGYYKSCRKTGEFAHAIGAFLVDPDRKVSRAVIGATETKPLLIADARHILGEFSERAAAAAFNRETLNTALHDSGMDDALERKTHVVALQRAVEQAKPQ